MQFLWEYIYVFIIYRFPLLPTPSLPLAALLLRMLQCSQPDVRPIPSHSLSTSAHLQSRQSLHSRQRKETRQDSGCRLFFFQLSPALSPHPHQPKLKNNCFASFWWKIEYFPHLWQFSADGRCIKCSIKLCSKLEFFAFTFYKMIFENDRIHFTFWAADNCEKLLKRIWW